MGKSGIILAIDPGETMSGWVLYDEASRSVLDHGKEDNLSVLARVAAGGGATTLAVEMIASYGMAVGKEVFETCIWIGRFVQAWPGGSPIRVYRREVKIYLCGSMKAKDGNIRQALIDKLGPPGTKKQPGATYGVAGDAWSALAVAVTASEAEGISGS